MNILIWNNLSISQGNIFFFNNVFSKTLIQQANALSMVGHKVEIVITEQTKQFSKIIDNNVKQIFFSNQDIYNIRGSFASLEKDFYLENNTALINKIAEKLSNKLNSHYDAILLWETPAPFLKYLYPNSIILNQMPAPFCKAPFPHLISIDLEGLYRQGSIFVNNADIKNYVSNNNLYNEFKTQAANIFTELNPFEKHYNYLNNNFKKLSLLPLQVTNHYNFKYDTKYNSQTEFLYDALEKTKDNNAVIVTQYISKLLSDQCITKELNELLQKNYKHYYHDEIFDTIVAPSQYIVPYVDEVISCSSSIAFQAMLFNKKIRIFGKTFIEPYSSIHFESSEDQKIKYENTCKFILEKYSFLASNLLDGKFLTNYIEDAISKKNNNSINKYPSNLDLKNNYIDELLISFKQFDTKKELIKKGLIINNSQSYIEKFESMVNDKSIKVISFDIFDTLIARNITRPLDVYKILEQACYKYTNGRITNFCQLRCIAEVESRKLTKSNETSLNLIYKFIKLNFHIDDEIIVKLKKLEISIENKLSTLQIYGNKLFKIAQISNKPIVYTSDMYLPRNAILSLLKNNGYPCNYQLFLSVDEDASKKEGKLFDIVLDKLKISPNELLHIGDNKNNDHNVPNSKGIKTFRILSPIQSMKKNPSWKYLLENYDGIATSMILSLIANKYWSNNVKENECLSMFNDYNGKIFGYSCIGPMIFGYVYWIIQNCIKNKINKIFFLAREGKFCKIAYDILVQNYSNAPSAEYLYTSRRALNIATLNSELDIISIASQPFVNNSNIKQLLNSRFGISRELIPGKYNVNLEYTNEGRLKLIKSALDLKELIFEEARIEKELYEKYINNFNIQNDDNIAIVDIGWKCRMQFNLENIFNRPIVGFYYSTISDYEYGKLRNSEIHVYDHQYSSKLSKNFIDKHRHIIESLLCCEDSSFIKFQTTNDEIVPVFDSENDNKNRKIVLSNVKNGLTQFILDINKLLISDIIYETPTDFIDTLIELSCNSKDSTDQKLYSNLVFSDQIGGIQEKNCFTIDNSSLNLNVNDQKIDNNKQIGNKKLLNTIQLKTESKLFKLFLSDKKYEKYKRSRQQFFKDSKSKCLKRYYKLFS